MLIPVLLVCAAFLLLKWESDSSKWQRLLVSAFAIAITLRYLHWRVVETILIFGYEVHEYVVSLIVFFGESLLWYELIVILILLVRKNTNSSLADESEECFKSRNDFEYPGVDIFIPTFNEPIDVLEKSICGAKAIDWPFDKKKIFVLDDGNRNWLKDYCKRQNVKYLCRERRVGSKAGNINSAIQKSSSPFILILDADFAPLRKILVRSIGLFSDPKVGIVQVPHHFFNSDPVQVNLDLRNQIPDEQRFFFDVVQPSRDSWNSAFCCGSNGIIRRSALSKIGGNIPVESITEDLLLTMKLLRHGFITRYLGERLAIGLAPQSLQSYFSQRKRWARGAIQILFTKDGSFGPGLSIWQRLLFFPSHWFAQSFSHSIAVLVPGFFLLTGVSPFLNATVDEIIFYQLPAILASLLAMKFFAKSNFIPVSSYVHSLVQSFKLLPTVVGSLARPTGGEFVVTPKGSLETNSSEDRFLVYFSYFIIIATTFGVFLNLSSIYSPATSEELYSGVLVWAFIVIVSMFLVVTTATSRPALRSEERFYVCEDCEVVFSDILFDGTIRDISASGACVSVSLPEGFCLPTDRWVGVFHRSFGLVPGKIVRLRVDTSGGSHLSISFLRLHDLVRMRLVQFLYCENRSRLPDEVTYYSDIRMLSRIWTSSDPELPSTFPRPVGEVSPDLPVWLNHFNIVGRYCLSNGLDFEQFIEDNLVN